MANIKNDPAVVALVEKETAKAVKQTTAANVKALRAVTAEHVEFHGSAGSKDIVKALKNHQTAAIAALKSGE